jgi:hypothetical protein
MSTWMKSDCAPAPSLDDVARKEQYRAAYVINHFSHIPQTNQN